MSELYYDGQSNFDPLGFTFLLLPSVFCVLW